MSEPCIGWDCSGLYPLWGFLLLCVVVISFMFGTPSRDTEDEPTPEQELQQTLEVRLKEETTSWEKRLAKENQAFQEAKEQMDRLYRQSQEEVRKLMKWE